MTKTLFALGIAAALGAAAPAYAAPLTINPDGAPGGTNISFNTINWQAGNLLFTEMTDYATGDIFNTTVYGHGILASFSAGGISTTPAGHQFTYQFALNLRVVRNGDRYDFVTQPEPENFFRIYHDVVPAGAANETTGVGYNDGTLIFQGDILDTTLNVDPGTGDPLFADNQNGSLTVGANLVNNAQNPAAASHSAGGLDQSPGNGDVDNGVLTRIMSGSLNFEVDTGMGMAACDGTAACFDTDYFLNDLIVPILFDVNFNSELAAPFRQANPSDAVVGVVPDYGSDGASLRNGNSNANGADNRADFHVQGAATSVFQAESVPEPGTLALIGAGLLMLPGVRRRFSRG